MRPRHYLFQRSHDLFPTLLTYEEVRTKVEFALTSHDRHLRIGALRILAACATSNKRRRDSHDILQFCLAAEKVPLDVAGVRERIVKTRRVGSMATKDVEEDVVRLASQWLLGTDTFRVSWDGSMTTRFFRSVSNQPTSTMGPCCRMPCPDHGAAPRHRLGTCL